MCSYFLLKELNKANKKENYGCSLYVFKRMGFEIRSIISLSVYPSMCKRPNKNLDYIGSVTVTVEPKSICFIKRKTIAKIC